MPTAAPALLVSLDPDQPDDEPTTVLRCPHPACAQILSLLIEVDRAERWNRAEPQIDGDALELDFTTGEATFHHHGYLCGHCEQPVSLPERLTAAESWS